MPGDTLLANFAVACLSELEARLGVELTLKKGLLLDPILNHGRYALAIETLSNYATADKQPLFASESPEVAPAHVVDLLLACDPDGGDMKHLASCRNCLQRILDLYSLFFMVLEGMAPEDVREIHASRRFRSGLYSFLDSLDCTKRRASPPCAVGASR